MNTIIYYKHGKFRRRSAFTLVEAMVSTVLSGFAITGLIVGYATMARRAEYAVYSTAATAIAQQGIEQTRAAKWDTVSNPQVDELIIGNFSSYSVRMDMNMSEDVETRGTNYFTITSISANPPIKKITVDCVWSLDGGLTLFTNSITALRAPDQ